MSNPVSKAGMAIIRFTLQQRVQHGVMAISVLMLIFTGFPIKYSAEAWSPYVISFFGGFANMFLLHLIFAVLMVLTSVYHIIWLIWTFIKKGPSWEMIPTFKDFTDAFHHGKYLIGIEKNPPRYGRYSYLEKFEYIAIIWGVIVMGFSGLVLWFPGMFYWIPRWAFGVARVIHTNEAFVAMLALFVGHFFHVHFNPKIFPSSLVWWNGKISVHHLKDEHPLEYDELVKTHSELKEVGEHKHQGWAASKPLIYTQLVIFLGLFAVLLYTFVPLFFHGLF